jgi:Tat protein translocase TatB subunit
MFGIGPMELVIILALALIVLGPQKFPEAGRAVGKAMREFRSMTSDITNDLKFDLDDDKPRRVPSNTVYHDPEPEPEPRPSVEAAEPSQPEKNEPGPV